ncbi:hypothetical protein [Lapillicoccus sp.]|uniref:hypothetical protein n=1 Tax=Lapillicoccus sp. TaxID=1909287 RepID=UPI0032637973
MTQPNPTRTDLSPERAANLAENPHAGQGAVMLDIGGDVGAIVIHLDASWEGAEIEIEALDGSTVPALPEHAHTHEHEHGHPHRPHVAVVGRPAGQAVIYSAVFPELTQGRYALGQAGQPARLRAVEVEVTGGQVTELVWPDTARDSS